MHKIVVTGATSMIGVALIEEAIKNHVKVLAIVRENSKRLERLPKSELLQVLPCDIEKLNSLPQIEDTYDIFYHFAWNYTDKNGRNDSVLQTKNIITTLDAVNLAHELKCRKFIGAGSQAEYGKVQGIISPDTHTNPEVPYGIAKYAAGQLSKKLCEQYGMDYVWGRIFSVYGCFDNEGTMLNYAIDQFIQGKNAEFSAATQMWNYLNEHDAGRAFYLLGKTKNAKGIYCIAHPQSKPLKNYITELREIFGDSAECSFAQFNADVVGLNADVSKLKNDTGFCPQISFTDGMKKLIEYHRSHQKKEGINL